MNIQEAVKKAMESGGLTYRKSIQRADGRRQSFIQPTNSYDTCFIVTYCDGKAIVSCRNWNPTGDDLAANDWEVVDKKMNPRRTRTRIWIATLMALVALDVVKYLSGPDVIGKFEHGVLFMLFFLCLNEVMKG